MQHNFVFWIGNEEFKHFYGLHANASFKFDTPSNHPCHSYFLELFCLYGFNYTVKTVGEKVNHNDINICLIPAQGLPTNDYKLSQITAAAVHSRDIINWCYDNDVKVIIDRSRERSPWDINQMIQYLESEDLFDPFLFRVLVDHPTDRDIDQQLKKYQKYIIHSDFFFWEMGGFLHNYIQSDKVNKLNIIDSRDIEKKYDYSCMMGEVRKPHRLEFKKELFERGLLNNAFWTTVTRYSDDLIKARYQEYIDSFIKHKGQKLYDLLVEEKKVESYGLNNASDRIMPLQYYQSWFDIPVESCDKFFFYTEKTYKPIATYTPFIIHGAPNVNSFLQKRFEIYDELFDYNEPIVNEIQRIIREPVSIYLQDSVINKAEYNRNKLESSTTIEKFEEWLYRIFDQW